MKIRVLLLVCIAVCSISFVACSDAEQSNGENEAIDLEVVRETAAPVENEVDTANLGPNEFAYVEGDTTFIMKRYFLVMLKTGPTRDQDSLTSVQIQAQHMAHLDSVASLGKMDIAGPMEGHPEIQGMCIYNTTTLEEATALANADPAVVSGRLVVEVIPWWAAKGSSLR